VLIFLRANRAWLQPESMPKLLLVHWDTSDEDLHVNLFEKPIPVLCGAPRLEKNGSSWYLKTDVCRSVFFMLSRYEKAIDNERDRYDRFPSTAWVALKAGLSGRATVNECLQTRWKCMTCLWPHLKGKLREWAMIQPSIMLAR